MTLIRVASHRARQKLVSQLGYIPQGYFSLFFRGEFREVPGSLIPSLRIIKGITVARVDQSKLHKYFGSDYPVAA